MENVTEELVRQNGNQAAAVMADYASQGGGSVPKFSDFVILEPLTPEETALWGEANEDTVIETAVKLSKKILEKLMGFSSDVKGSWSLFPVSKILEIDDAGNILAIETNLSYLAKNSSMWAGTNVPDLASDDYFYHIEFSVGQ